MAVMGKSQLRLGFISQFGRFLRVIQQFNDSIWQTDDWDLI